MKIWILVLLLLSSRLAYADEVISVDKDKKNFVISNDKTVTPKQLINNLYHRQDALKKNIVNMQKELNDVNDKIVSAKKSLPKETFEAVVKQRSDKLNKIP